jgi:hypothetical protein
VHDSDEDVGDAVLQYLAEHPQAADTLAGIASWWLMRHEVRVTVTTLNRVLRALAERGVLEVIGEGEHRRYRLRS